MTFDSSPPGATAEVHASHKAGMTTLFTTEMWERFAFYGMKALLVPYLISAYQFSESAAKEALGVYILLVYMSPLFAGIISDRFLNLRMSMYVGAIVMALGEFALAAHSAFIGMALIIAGNGFFKPCATNMVGALYPTRHPARTSMYSLFYFGINLGAFISPIICGSLREHSSAEWGFAAAGIGMLLGLATLCIFERKLETAGFRDDEQIDRSAASVRIDARSWVRVGITAAITAGVVTVMALDPVRGVLNLAWTPKWLLGDDVSATALFLSRMAIVGALLWGYMRIVPKTGESRPLTSDEKHRWWVIGAITFAMFFLTVALEQAGGVLNLFAKNNTEPTLLGIEIPFEFYQSVNPMGVIFFTLLTAWLWPVLEKRGVNDLHKLGPGLLIVAVAFFVEKSAFAITADGTKASPGWLFAIYFLISAGEVCISVIGLSAVNKLAPPHMKAFSTAVFFVAIACGGYLAGTVESILNDWSLDPWLTLGIVSVVLGGVYILAAPKLKKLAHGVI